MTEPSKWQILHERGVTISDERIDQVIGALEGGAKTAQRGLHCEGSRWPHFVFSDNHDAIGYAPAEQAINVPIAYLNSLTFPLDKGEIPLERGGSIPFLYWLEIVGRAFTVMHYQHIGHPDLHAPYDATQSEQSPACIAEIQFVVDEICLANNQMPFFRTHNAVTLRRLLRKEAQERAQQQYTHLAEIANLANEEGLYD